MPLSSKELAESLQLIRDTIAVVKQTTAYCLRMMKTMNYTREQIAAECRKWGSQVGPLPAGVDGATLLWAIAGVESGFGVNCTPRHEPAYDKGGRYSTHAPMPGLLENFGSDAACSYGPWQMMLCNFPIGTTPDGAANQLDITAQDSVLCLNRLLREWKPVNLDQIGECWNAGRIVADPDYTSKLERNYVVPMPTAPAQ